MNKNTLIGIDLAKKVFQICAMTQRNKVTFNKQVKRAELAEFMANQPSTVVAMEACYSSHYWARVFQPMGHTVKLIPAQHVTPFVRGNKSDRNDAVAICEAALRPGMRFVPVKTLEQQDIQSLHRLRERHISQRTALMNQVRGLMSEYGVIAPKGHKSFCRLLREITAPESDILSVVLKNSFALTVDEYYQHCDSIEELSNKLIQIACNNPLCAFLLSIPGIGVINATSIVSAIGNGSQFNNGREFAVWLGLTPKQAASGERSHSGAITKRGNRYLRKQLVHGARAAVSRCRNKNDRVSQWVNKLIARRGVQKTYISMAARMARTAWILLHNKEMYKPV